jgi:hypothetical protein
LAAYRTGERTVPERVPERVPEGRRQDGTFRIHARSRVNLKALVTHVQSGWQRTVQVEDLGLGGARVLLDEPLVKGDSVTLSFTAPSLWDPLVLRARVAWISHGATPRRVGVAFEHRSPDAAFALYELIANLEFE